MTPLIDMTDPQALLRLFAEVLAEPDRINGDDLQTCIGVKQQIDGRPYVVLHEGALLHHLAEAGRLDPGPRNCDGQHRLAFHLLQVLALAGVLYTGPEDMRRSPWLALWTVEWHGAHGRKSVWPAALIVAVGDDLLPHLAALPDADGVLHVRRHGAATGSGEPSMVVESASA